MRAIVIAEDDEEWAYLQWLKDDLTVRVCTLNDLPRENITVQRWEEN